MKLNPTPRSARAFSMTELAIVVVMLLLLGVVLMYYLAVSNRPHGRAARIRCVNNLKQIGLAYRVFSNDNDDKYRWHNHQRFFKALCQFSIMLNHYGFH